MSSQTVKRGGRDAGEPDQLTHDGADTAIFGFWVFLMSDAVVFALLFATYGVMLTATAGGPTPAGEYKILPAFLETLILLTSSFTFGIASVAMKHGSSRRRLLGWMGLTLVLGFAFLAMEMHDFCGDVWRCRLSHPQRLSFVVFRFGAAARASRLFRMHLDDRDDGPGDDARA